MAILKAINYKSSGHRRFVETLQYIANPQKTDDFNVVDEAEDFELDCMVNRELHGQQDRKRQFKQFVVSLETTWSDNEYENSNLRQRISYALSDVERIFASEGFLAKGVVHLNTEHPHFHLVVETCNALTGRQYSQSPADLSKLKSTISEILVVNKLSETVRMREVSEEDLLSEEDGENLSSVYIPDEISTWNGGTPEQMPCCDTDSEEVGSTEKNRTMPQEIIPLNIRLLRQLEENKQIDE